MKKMIKTMKTGIMRRKKEKGSALLISLMVMVALSLLGLGFVAVSETESAISVNDRNNVQTLNVAESGTRLVVEWFQNADWADRRGVLPPNIVELKTQRNVDTSKTGTPLMVKSYYKEDTSKLLFDLPFKPAMVDRFWGTETSADIWINDSRGSDTKDFLARFNTILLQGNDAGGKVTDIRIYAPPIVGGTLVADPDHPTNFFWKGGQRYGVATIRVTATKTDTNGNRLSERVVKAVVSEFPFPGPEGPLQSNTGISTNGDFQVHWGKMTSQGTLGIKNPIVSIPWRTAWREIAFERGYETATADPTTNLFPVDNTSTDIDLKYPWLYEVLNKSFPDPWFQGRARGDITSDGGSVANQPYPYDDITDPVTTPGVSGYSNQFQNQDENDESKNKKEVLFPKIDYLFWKQIAQAGSAAGTDGIYYLTWSSADQFTLRGVTKTFRQWVDTLTGAKPGYYFFDTKDGSNPQNSDGSTNVSVLTPAIDEKGSDMHMRGFIYLNCVSFGTQGLGGKPGLYNFPGETYKDVGFRPVAIVDDLTATPPQNKGKFIRKFAADGVTVVLGDVAGALNGVWDHEELPWSNGATKVNNEFDVFVKKVTVTRSSGGAAFDVFLPVPYTEGCVPGNNLCAGCNCSEPHEPYLNFLYPTAPGAVTVGWEDPGVAGAGITRAAKEFQDTAKTTAVTCTTTSAVKDCTSNAYDDKGPLVELSKKGPVLDGVLYNEGGYDSTGNATYFGSVLIRGQVSKAGTVDIYYDDSLSKGDWQKRFTDMPRVLITAMETDR